MATCTVKPEASSQFSKLCAHWKKQFPHIAEDLNKVFAAISQDILACKAARLQAGVDLEVYKYRQNSTDVKRGASYGWRIIAVFHRPTQVMYPIIVYPKTAWQDASAALVADSLREIRRILGYCISPGCDGTMTLSDGSEQTPQDNQLPQRKMHCSKCRSIQWVAE